LYDSVKVDGALHSTHTNIIWSDNRAHP